MALGRAVGVLDEAGADVGGAASGELEQPAIVIAAASANIHLRGAVMGGE